jgi:hypothetical protein
MKMKLRKEMSVAERVALARLLETAQCLKNTNFLTDGGLRLLAEEVGESLEAFEAEVLKHSDEF